MIVIHISVRVALEMRRSKLRPVIATAKAQKAKPPPAIATIGLKRNDWIKLPFAKANAERVPRQPMQATPVMICIMQDDGRSSANRAINGTQ